MIKGQLTAVHAWRRGGRRYALPITTRQLHMPVAGSYRPRCYNW